MSPALLATLAALAADGGAPVFTITSPDGGVATVELAGGEQYVDFERTVTDAGITPIRAAISYEGALLTGPLWAFTPDKVKELDRRLDVLPAQGLADAGVSSANSVVWMVTSAICAASGAFSAYAANRTARHLGLWP